MTGPAPPPLDPSLPLCEMLEQEYTAITGQGSYRAPRWKLAPAQILEPERLADRLRDSEVNSSR